MTRFLYYQRLYVLIALCVVALICAPAGAASLVEVSPVEAMTGTPTLTLSGDLQSIRSVSLAAEVAGVIDQIRVDAGELVEAGQVLAVIREKPAALRLRAMEAQLADAVAAEELAGLVEQRLRSLIASRAVSADGYDVARLELEQATALVAERKAAVEQQADILQRHRISAPFNAVVARRMVEQGQWLNAGDSCYALESVDVLRVVLAVPQKYFGQVGVGSPVEIRIDAQPELALQAEVGSLVPVIRRSGRTFEARVDLDNRELQLAPGMSLRASLGLSDKKLPPLILPRDAVLRRADGYTWVWRLAGSAGAHTVTEVEVQAVSARNDDLVVRSAELNIGDQVVVRGNEGLRADMAVRVQGQE